MSADFKATMDEYEAFFDEYVAFMQKYQENPTSTELLAQYASYMEQYADTMAALSAIDQNSLSTADALHLVEVQARITAKVAEVL